MISGFEESKLKYQELIKFRENDIEQLLEHSKKNDENFLSTIATMKNEEINLKKQIVVLNTKFDELYSDYSITKTKHDSHANELEKLASETNHLKRKNSEFEKTNQDLNVKLEKVHRIKYGFMK